MIELQARFEGEAEKFFGMPADSLKPCRAPEPTENVAYLCERDEDSAVLSAMWWAYQRGAYGATDTETIWEKVEAHIFPVAPQGETGTPQ